MRDLSNLAKPMCVEKGLRASCYCVYDDDTDGDDYAGGGEYNDDEACLSEGF